MRRVILFLMVVYCIGCDRYCGLYVDDSCTDREYELIEEAVDKFNTVVPEDYGIVWKGRVNASKKDRVGTGPKSRDVVFCFPLDTDEPVLQGYVGHIDHDDVLLRQYEDDNYFLRLAMHELGHYGAEAVHVADPESIMYHSIGGGDPAEYTDIDVAEFYRALGISDQLEVLR